MSCQRQLGLAFRREAAPNQLTPTLVDAAFDIDRELPRSTTAMREPATVRGPRAVRTMPLNDAPALHDPSDPFSMCNPTSSSSGALGTRTRRPRCSTGVGHLPVRTS